MARSRHPTRRSTRHASNLSEQLIGTLRESALWVFGALAFVLWLALFSYDPADPGFTQASGTGEINNAVGRVGALVADLLFNLF
jgi:S-DNA-T family DNA segregation ATPase FtsK/SpoIIIE